VARKLFAKSDVETTIQRTCRGGTLFDSGRQEKRVRVDMYVIGTLPGTWGSGCTITNPGDLALAGGAIFERAPGASGCVGSCVDVQEVTASAKNKANRAFMIASEAALE
jgi:hypothetical protein